MIQLIKAGRRVANHTAIVSALFLSKTELYIIVLMILTIQEATIPP